MPETPTRVLSPDVLGPDELDRLDPDPTVWHPFDWDDEPGVIRRLDATTYVAVVHYLYTWGLIVGPIANGWHHDHRWCFGTFPEALYAGHVYDGTAEPVGFIRKAYQLVNGQHVRDVRLARGLGLAELARRAGVPKGYLSTIERAEAPRPGAETVYKLAQALGVRMTDLMGLPREP